MIRVEVAPALLHWACERSGRSNSDLRKRFPQVEAWKQGEVQPTLKQLEAFAKTTHTPIGYLFLQRPPVETLPIPDFRTIGDKGIRRPSPNLLDTLYLCQQRQDWYRDEVHATDEPPLEFVGSLKTTDDIVSSAIRLRDTLDFDVKQRRQSSTWTEALRQVIEQADKLGILVMVSGVVGNNTHRRLDPQEFRGFALSDPRAPLVFVNGADTKAAQMFTLVHEIAHLWLGESGVSNVEVATFPAVHSTESWCNQVAAELLVPSDLVRAEFESGRDLDLEELNRLARLFKVSTLVILRCIYEMGQLDKDEFWSVYGKETDRLQQYAGGSGGNYYTNVVARASERLARSLVVSALEGRTSFTAALHLLDIKKTSVFQKIARNLGIQF